ncbi:MAG: DUF5995 family protein [Acidimicrobiales bacterium]
MVETVEDILRALDAVVDHALEVGSRDGYFAALYRQVTAKVRDGIATGFFDDGPRMERLDVAFARRYLDAHALFGAGSPPTRSWKLAFEAGAEVRPLILQHLLLGINAHINLDLGIAAAATAPGDALPGLRADFDRINEILAVLVDRVQHEMNEVSPCLGLLDRIGGRHDDEVIRFSLEVARTEAWRFAVELAPLARESWGGPIGARDTRVARLARVVLDPGWPLTAGLMAIRTGESNDVRRVIRVLAGVDGPDLAVVEARVRTERATPTAI